MTILLIMGSAISYKGVLEDHANKASKLKGNSEAFAGGASLDLLGLIVVVQYGTVLVSEKIYWLLILIPLWGGWKIYSIFFGSNKLGSGFMPKQPVMESNNDDTTDEATEEANAKRQKRSERRRQKWT